MARTSTASCSTARRSTFRSWSSSRGRCAAARRCPPRGAGGRLPDRGRGSRPAAAGGARRRLAPATLAPGSPASRTSAVSTARRSTLGFTSAGATWPRWWTTRTSTSSRRSPELYDIVADPGEKNDLAAGLPPAFRSMRAELDRMPRPLQAPGGSDPEQVKKLAALGYISASTADFEKKDLPAPRDRIGAVAQLKRASARCAPDATPRPWRSSRAAPAEPGMTDVWQMYWRRAHEARPGGEGSRGAADGGASFAREPAGPDGAVRLLPGDRQLRRGPQARGGRRRRRDGDPHENLARIALARGGSRRGREGGARGAREVPDAPHSAPDPRPRAPRPRATTPARSPSWSWRARPQRQRATCPAEPATTSGATASRVWAANGRRRQAFLEEIRDFPAGPRRAPRSRCSTRARDGRPRRAKPLIGPRAASSARPRPTSPRSGPTRCWATFARAGRGCAPSSAAPFPARGSARRRRSHR